MTVKLAGIWEDGYNFPMIEHWLWDYPCVEYNVDEWIMTPISGLEGNMVEMPSIQSAIDSNPELTVVFVDEKGSLELAEFTHPKDVLYIFGRSSQSHFDPAYISIKIKTPNSGGRLWAHQAACIILDHRYRNGDNSN